jgi:hypothetical protein
MLALPHVSGSECINVLTTHFGYRLRGRAGGLASLVTGMNLVIVPENATLSPALLAALLRTAKVDPLDFLGVLSIDVGPAPRPAPRVQEVA